MVLSKDDFKNNLEMSEKLDEGAHAKVNKAFFNHQPVCVKIYDNQCKVS